MSDIKTRTIRDALDLFAALQKLDGCKFENASTHYRIARNIRALAPIAESVEDMRKKLILSIAPAGTIQQGTVEHAKYVEEFEKVLRGPLIEDPRIYYIAFGDLRVAENNIPPTTLAALDPILVSQPDLI